MVTVADLVGLLKLARERDASIDRATVYRTLELFKKLRSWEGGAEAATRNKPEWVDAT